MLVTPEISDNTNKDVAILRKDGYGVDENKNPSPENIPTPSAKNDKVMYHVNTIYLYRVVTLVMTLSPAPVHQACW